MQKIIFIIEKIQKHLKCPALQFPLISRPMLPRRRSPFRNHFFKTGTYSEDEGDGMERLVSGTIGQAVQKVDRFVTAEVTNFLFLNKTKEADEKEVNGRGECRVQVLFFFHSGKNVISRIWLFDAQSILVFNPCVKAEAMIKVTRSLLISPKTQQYLCCVLTAHFV